MNTFHDKITSVRNSWMILSLGSSFQDRNVPIFQKYFTALEIRIGATNAELAKCEGIPLVFRIESLIFDDSEFWLEPIALDRFRKVHGFASSLLPPLPFSFSLLLIVLGLKSLEVDFMSFLSSVNEIVDICESSRDFEKNLIQSSFAIVCLSLKKLINIF